MQLVKYVEVGILVLSRMFLVQCKTPLDYEAGISVKDRIVKVCFSFSFTWV